jgi:hypothetical protein
MQFWEKAAASARLNNTGSSHASLRDLRFSTLKLPFQKSIYDLRSFIRNSRFAIVTRPEQYAVSHKPYIKTVQAALRNLLNYYEERHTL